MTVPLNEEEYKRLKIMLLLEIPEDLSAEITP